VIVFAAIDLLAGEVVQLVGGRPQSMRIRLTDPVAVAQQWVKAGFQALHVVDLDAARGTGNNREVIEAILDAVNVPVQVGGGLRELSQISQIIERGAARVIVGTRAIEDSIWLQQVATELPNRLIVAGDVNQRHIVTRGWTHETNLELEAVFESFNALPLAATLITDVSREGQMTGINRNLFEWACSRSRHPVYAAGGIRDLDDLRVLEQAGAGGAVLGMSIYTGAIDPAALEGVFK
jgi:phosphoribosylformimino-5-aminoimidazole carboxamide ribotide isomerase